MSVLNEAHFHCEEAAYAKLESIVWPNGPVCPHCGNADPARVYKIEGKTARLGLRTCAECRQQFTVKVGTVFESSHVPLHKWFQAAHLMASSKKGISAHQLHRTLKVTYKTAWFMAHRLREAMRDGEFAPMGGNGKIVEADETYYGRTKKKRQLLQKRQVPYTKGGWKDKGSARPVVALVERGGDYGTIEGRLETIQESQGSLQFMLRDAMLRSKVRCYFPEELLPEVFDKFRKRVEVSGVIHYRKNGTPISIMAQHVMSLPDDSELPTADDVRGILRN